MKQSYDPMKAVAEFPEGDWEKSQYSGQEGGGGCVDVNLASFASTGLVGLRDSTQPGAAAFKFDGKEWGDFVRAVKDGQFDLPA